ncbi:hypothetical protein FQN49_008262, partial [Arthroderma sp. PD_2]
MASPCRLTIASTWKLETEGIDQVTNFFKTLPHGSDGFCKYESTDHVFTIDNCDISRSTSALAEFLGEFVQNEKENDLLENPKITRVAIATGPEEGDAELDSDGDDQLIESLPPPEAMNLPMAIKYWQEGAAIDCFVKAPRSLLTAVTQATGAQVDIEASNNRIRVTSTEAWQGDNAIERLSNLQKFL